MSSPAVSSLFLLASPRCLPHFLPLSSVRQLSYWHSHRPLRTRWISPLLQKSFCTEPQPRWLTSARLFPFSIPPAHSFPSTLCSLLSSPHLCVCSPSLINLSAPSSLYLHLSVFGFYYLLLCLSAGAVDEFKLTEVKDCVMLPFGNKKTPFVSFILHVLLKIHMLKGLFSLNFYTNDQ